MSPHSSSPHSHEPDSALTDSQLQRGKGPTRQEQAESAARKMRNRSAVQELHLSRSDADPLFGGEA
jgi:hypothetical protein